MRRVAVIIPILLATPLLVNAGLVACTREQVLAGDCGLCSVVQTFLNVYELFAFTLIPILAALLFAWGGVMFYFSAGNPEKVGKGKKILINTLVGLFIVYTAYFTVGMFLEAIGYSEDWYNLGC